MEKVIYYLKQSEPVNMKHILDNISVFFISANLCFAMITADQINVITGVLGLAFLLLRNVPFIIVRLWEVFIFTFNKRDRSRIISFWRDEMNKKELETPKNEVENEK